MQAAVMEESSGANSYDSLFPALPESNISTVSSASSMRVVSSVVTQVFTVPYEERKLDSDKFGEGESWRTCQYIMKDTGAHIEISSGKDKSLTFLMSGKINEVLEARRKILIHFQTQASKQIIIPKEHHRWILGKKGDRLKELEKVTATKINVPNISEESDNITISGTKEGIEKAEHEIRTMSDEQSKKAKEHISVPKMYHPFILGPFNENLNKMVEETGARINVPPQSVMKDEIIITGEKEGVFAARAKIEQIYKQMEKKCQTVSVEVPKIQHRYVIGQRGSTIQEILKLTGVSVEMPPSDSKTDTITLRGPQEKLGTALSTVYEKANSVLTSVMEAPAWIHKFIIGHKGANIKEFSAEYHVNVEFLDNKIKIEGAPEWVEKAREKLEEVCNDYVTKLKHVEMDVNPIHYKHIIGKSGANINRLKEDYEVIISIEEKEGSNRIRIDGPMAGVDKALIELQEKINKLENEKERVVNLDRTLMKALRNNRDKIRDFKDRFQVVQIFLPGPSTESESIKLRGPKDEVDKCNKQLLKLLDEIKESSFVLDVPIHKQYHKFIIGKGGVNIKKIRDETQTKIDLPAEGDEKDVITITGKRENVYDARDRILKIKNELAETVTEEVTIPPKYYNAIIGTRGKFISALEDGNKISIKFPTTDSQSDKVIIRGPKDDVERAKAQLIEMSNERELSSYQVEIRAKPQYHKFLIGKNGATIKKIRDSTGARIVFPTSSDDDSEIIKIIGKKENVEQAKILLEANIKDIDNTTEAEIDVDPKYHKHFVARRGEVLHKISEECGEVSISFPRAGEESSRVILKGPKDCIDAAKQRITEIVTELEYRVTIDCVIPQMHHRTVMGPKGCNVQAIRSDYNVQIKFPDREIIDHHPRDEQPAPQMNGDLNGGESQPAQEQEQQQQQQQQQQPASDVIKITGLIEKCEAAREALLKLVPITEEINVPFDLHGFIKGSKGSEVRDLQSRYNVRIELSSNEQRLDIIKLTGAPENVEDAKKAIEERVVQLEDDRKDRELRSYELKMEVDQEFHPKIIGKRGTVINKIRADHGVQISFPKRDDAEANVITIQGYEASAQAAKDDILKIVNDFSDLYKEVVRIDDRVHSRIIGQRGRSINKIREDFKVEIKFPKAGDADSFAVTITGTEDNVMEAKDHLLNLEEEYLQDVSEVSIPTQQTAFSAALENAFTKSNNNNAANQRQGFVVQGAPWQKGQPGAPNTESQEDFPDFGLGAAPAEQPTISSAWGPRN